MLYESVLYVWEIGNGRLYFVWKVVRHDCSFRHALLSYKYSPTRRELLVAYRQSACLYVWTLGLE